jgi:alkylation response protein AidB-like acyl-CoA dehydrogenase
MTHSEAGVNLAFSDEQEQLRQSVRRFLADKSPMSEVRRLMGTQPGYDPAVWAQLAQQLGLLGLAIPREYGGSGFGFAELAIVLEEMGRALFCGPYFSTAVLATAAILSAADDQHKKQLLPDIAVGQMIAALAVAEDDGRWDAAAVRLDAIPAGDRYLLTGHKAYVLDGNIADLVITVGRIDGELAFFAVDGDAEGLTRTPLPTLDMTRPQSRLEFAATPGRLIGDPRLARRALARTLDLAAVGLSAEMAGGAQRCLDMSVNYAKTRVQFGRPIGSFQAIKHKCANMLIEVESAKTAAHYAARAAAADSDELATVASLAKAYCSEAYFHAAGENIQIHGGIGFTWEHDAHMYFKRAKSSELMLGDPAYHRELLAQRIGLCAEEAEDQLPQHIGTAHAETSYES